MPEAIILFCSQSAKVCCDGKCNKAWGINNRPTQQLDEDDDDDFEFLADGELGEAPVDPGTIEGGFAKPLSVTEFPNNWCVLECERCSMSDPGKENEPLLPKTFETRDRNKVISASPNIQAVAKAFEPFSKALTANDTDTLGSLTSDDQVIFGLAGSWTNKQLVTLGNLRQLAKAIAALQKDAGD